MATLNATLSISSTDLFDSINIAKTVSKALTIDGDNRQGLTVIKTSTTRMGIVVEALSGTTGGAKKAYVYIKNLDSTDTIIIEDDGDAIFASLDPGEFCFFPSADNTTVQVKASANTPLVEYLILEVD
jgi:hypothetical protein|tara:strand:+ start:5026 stop:5409 length:384 start_codon:yes stop_codon:yes gene_type:complete